VNDSSSPAPTPHPILLYGLIGVMVACWTFNFIIGKWGLGYIDPLTLASFRVILAAAILGPVYLGTARRLEAEAAKNGVHRARLGRADLWNFARLGLFGVAMNQVLFTIGLSYTTAGHSSLIIGSGPIFILLLAWTQRLESLTAKKLIGMGMAFSGVAVLAAEHGISLSAGTFRGDVITFIGSLAFAGYAVLSKKVARLYDSVAMNFFSFLAGSLIILPLAIRQAARLDWAAVEWQGWTALFYMAVFGSVVPYLIFYWTLRHLAASRVAAFGYLHPVMVTTLGVLALGEKITVNLLVGGPLVLAGVYLTEMRPRENGGKIPATNLE
jgi:drug/metabolite transporter (DMT)-like permease